jgi:ABC-type nitrate/sulfonate/bicarbonate transport system substrate-binding protein
MRNFHALLAGCFLLSLVTGAAGADKVRVAVVSPTPNVSVPWIGKDAGIFAKHGLDAEVILLTGSPRLVQSLIAGDVDYAVVGASATMRARMRGADVVILAATTNVSSQKIIVGKNSGIRRLEDLKGRIIGVSQFGSEADGFARAVLSRTALRPEKDATILQLGGHPQVAAALVAGKIEAGVLGGLTFMTAQKSGAVVLTSAVDLKMVSLGAVLAATGAYVQRNRGSVTRFMRAFVEAIDYFKTNREGTVPIIQKYMGGISAENARFLYEETVGLFEELPVPAEKGLQEGLARESDPKAKNFKPADFIDLSFLKEIDKSGLVDKLYRK